MTRGGWLLLLAGGLPALAVAGEPRPKPTFHDRAQAEVTLFEGVAGKTPSTLEMISVDYDRPYVWRQGKLQHVITRTVRRDVEAGGAEPTASCEVSFFFEEALAARKPSVTLKLDASKVWFRTHYFEAFAAWAGDDDATWTLYSWDSMKPIVACKGGYFAFSVPNSKARAWACYARDPGEAHGRLVLVNDSGLRSEVAVSSTRHPTHFAPKISFAGGAKDKARDDQLHPGACSTVDLWSQSGVAGDAAISGFSLKLAYDVADGRAAVVTVPVSGGKLDAAKAQGEGFTVRAAAPASK